MPAKSKHNKIISLGILITILFSGIPVNAQEEFVIENDCEVDSDAILNYLLIHEAENFEAWYQRGIIEYDCGRYENASFYFSAALGLDPNHEQAQKYKELSEQKVQEERQAQETESANIELILVIGVWGGALGLIIWYYGRKKKR